MCECVENGFIEFSLFAGLFDWGCFCFFFLHIRVIVSKALLHPSVTAHHSKMNLWFASSDCPIYLPSDAINTKTETQPTLGQNIQNNSCNERKHPCAQLDSLPSGFSGSTLAFSSDEKAVLVRFLSLVPAELRGEEEECTSCASWVLQSWRKVAGYQEAEFNTLLYPFQKKMLSLCSVTAEPSGQSAGAPWLSEGHEGVSGGWGNLLIHILYTSDH